MIRAGLEPAVFAILSQQSLRARAWHLIVLQMLAPSLAGISPGCLSVFSSTISTVS